MRVDYEREGPTSIWVVTVSHTSCRAAWNHCRGFVSRDGCVRAATACPDRRARGTDNTIQLKISCWSLAVYVTVLRFFPTVPVPSPRPSKQRRWTNLRATTRRGAPAFGEGSARLRGLRPVVRLHVRLAVMRPGGAAVASSGDNAFVLRGRGRPARLVGAYSVATPAAGRTTVHEGPRDPYDYRTTSVYMYPNAIKQDAYYREFVSHLSQPICPCAPGRETESTPHRSRHTVRRPRDSRAMCERVKPRAVSAHVFSAAPCPPPAAVPRDPGSTPVDPAGRPDPKRPAAGESGSVDAVQTSFSSTTTRAT